MKYESIGGVWYYDLIPLNTKGVYEFYDDNTEESLYIGKAQDLRKRLYQYAELGYSSAYKRYELMNKRHYDIGLRIYKTKHPAALESKLLAEKKPKFNIRINE